MHKKDNYSQMVGFRVNSEIGRQIRALAASQNKKPGTVVRELVEKSLADYAPLTEKKTLTN